MLRLWDVSFTKGRDHRLVEAPTLVAAFSPDGKTILTADYNRTARLWDAATGRTIGQPLAYQGDIRTVAFSPDGKTCVTATEWRVPAGSGGGEGRLWETATGKPLGQPLPIACRTWCVAFSPDGKTLVTGSPTGTAQLWDTASGRPVGQPLGGIPEHLRNWRTVQMASSFSRSK